MAKPTKGIGNRLSDGPVGQGSVHFRKTEKNVPIKFAIAISIAIVFKKVNAKARAKAQKIIWGGAPGAPGPRPPQIFRIIFQNFLQNIFQIFHFVWTQKVSVVFAPSKTPTTIQNRNGHIDNCLVCVALCEGCTEMFESTLCSKRNETKRNFSKEVSAKARAKAQK